MQITIEKTSYGHFRATSDSPSVQVVALTVPDVLRTLAEAIEEMAAQRGKPPTKKPAPE